MTNTPALKPGDGKDFSSYSARETPSAADKQSANGEVVSDFRRRESPLDDMNGWTTYTWVENGQYRAIRVDLRSLREHGIRTILEAQGLGHVIPTERVSVHQNGKQIGTVPGDFDPLAVKSKSFFFDMRPGDFTRDGDKWIAHRSLCPGDFAAVPGFVWDDRRISRSLEEIATFGEVFKALDERSESAK